MKKKNQATVVGLVGELGTGKTTFVKRFAKALGITEHITSPTFVILKKYGNLIHVDAYRLRGGKELLALGFQELLDDPRNIIFIEWADRVADVLPKDRLMLRFEHVDEDTRKIQITSTKTQTNSNGSSAK